jgi:hypothetical protein
MRWFGWRLRGGVRVRSRLGTRRDVMSQSMDLGMKKVIHSVLDDLVDTRVLGW